MEFRKHYPADAGDGAWAFVAPSPTPTDEAGPQRRHRLKVQERAE